MIKHQKSLIGDTPAMILMVERFKKLESLPPHLDFVYKPSVESVYKLHLALLEIMSGKTLNKDNYLQVCSEFYAKEERPLISRYFWFLTFITFRNEAVYYSYERLFMDAIADIESTIIHEDLYFTIEVMLLFTLSPINLDNVKYDFVDNYENTLYMLHCLHHLYNFLFNFKKNLSII